MTAHATGIYPDVRSQLVDLAEDLAATAALHIRWRGIADPLGAASAAVGNACQAAATGDNGRIATARSLCDVLTVALHPSSTPHVTAANLVSARRAGVTAAGAGRALLDDRPEDVLRALPVARGHLASLQRLDVQQTVPVRIGADQPAVVTRAVPA